MVEALGLDVPLELTLGLDALGLGDIESRIEPVFLIEPVIDADERIVAEAVLSPV